MSDADLIKVAIIKDKNEIREGLRTLIHGTPAHRCTGAFRSMEEALERIGQEVPTVILVYRSGRDVANRVSKSFLLIRMWVASHSSADFMESIARCSLGN